MDMSLKLGGLILASILALASCSGGEPGNGAGTSANDGQAQSGSQGQSNRSDAANPGKEEFQKGKNRLLANPAFVPEASFMAAANVKEDGSYEVDLGEDLKLVAGPMIGDSPWRNVEVLDSDGLVKLKGVYSFVGPVKGGKGLLYGPETKGYAIWDAKTGRIVKESGILEWNGLGVADPGLRLATMLSDPENGSIDDMEFVSAIVDDNLDVLHKFGQGRLTVLGSDDLLVFDSGKYGIYSAKGRKFHPGVAYGDGLWRIEADDATYFVDGSLMRVIKAENTGGEGAGAKFSFPDMVDASSFAEPKEYEYRRTIGELLDAQKNNPAFKEICPMKFEEFFNDFRSNLDCVRSMVFYKDVGLWHVTGDAGMEELYLPGKFYDANFNPAKDFAQWEKTVVNDNFGGLGSGNVRELETHPELFLGNRGDGWRIVEWGSWKEGAPIPDLRAAMGELNKSSPVRWSPSTKMEYPEGVVNRPYDESGAFHVLVAPDGEVVGLYITDFS